MSSEDSALEVLETQSEPTPTPHKEVRGGGHTGRDGLADLMAEHGDINAEQAKSIKEANVPKVEKQRNAKGQFAAKEKADSHQDEPQVSDNSDPEKSEAVAVEPEELKTLAAALVRYNATKADQDALAKGDPDAVKSARHLLKIQTDNDDHRTQSEANKAELETLRAQIEQQKTEAAKAPPKTEFNLDAVVKPLADTLTELHGEDQSESVRNLVTNILEQVDSKYAERDKATAAIIKEQGETIKEQGETIKSLQRDGLDNRFQNACQTLQDEFPQLKDETLRATVMERMIQIATSGPKQYDSVLDAARDATRIEVAPLILEEAKAYGKKHRKAKDNGVADINPSVAEEPKGTSRREMSLQALRYLDPDSPDYNPAKSKEITNKAAQELRS